MFREYFQVYDSDSNLKRAREHKNNNFEIWASMNALSSKREWASIERSEAQHNIIFTA